MSFTAPTRERSGPMLSLAGMVDIMFLLLVFFMTTSVFREKDQLIDVALPAAEAGTSAASATRIVITITADDEIYIGEKRYTVAALRRTLRQLAAQFPEESVVIRGDRGSRLQTAVSVMDIVYGAHLTNVALGTNQPSTRPQ